MQSWTSNVFMQMVERCKRMAASDETPLRQIFNDICCSAPETAQQISFSELEGAMYKRRRLSQPALPTSGNEAHEFVNESRYAQVDGEDFYRGAVDVDNDGIALIFASQQLSLLESSSGVYFDGTFKVVPSIFFQLFTLFMPCFDFAFPVLFALMSRKT